MIKSLTDSLEPNTARERHHISLTGPAHTLVKEALAESHGGVHGDFRSQIVVRNVLLGLLEAACNGLSHVGERLVIVVIADALVA